MRQPPQLDNYKQHIMVGKREPIKNFNLFLVLTCWSTGSHSLTPPVDARLNFELVKLRLLTSSSLCVELVILPHRYSPKTTERTLAVPSLPPGVSKRDIRFSSLPLVRTGISDNQCSLVIFNCNKSLALAVR